MNPEIVRLRSQVLERSGCGRSERYPRGVREGALAVMSDWLAQGRSLVELSVQLGVPASTLWTWWGRRPRDSGPLVAVRVVDAERDAPIRLVLGGGSAKLSVCQLAELLRRLS